MTFEELAESGKEVLFYGVDDHFIRLDDDVFEAVEDESDGYRSYLEDIKHIVNDERVFTLIFFATPLDVVKVRKSNEECFSGYEIFSVEDNHVWLKLGTDNFDDYYPNCIFNYEPRRQ